MVHDLEQLLSETQIHAQMDDSEAMVNGMLFVLCTAAIIFTGVVLVLHAAPV